MEIIKQGTQIDFMGKSRIAMMGSGILIVIAFVSILLHGGLRYGIDFAGGTLVQLQFKNPPSLEDIREGLSTIGLGDSTLQEFGSKNDILIHVEKSEEKLETVGTQIRESLIKSLGTDEITVERVEMVGPKVGKDLREKAMLSIIYAIIGIVLYITWRFELQYALAANMAQVHDIIITMGAF
ncbi:MAG: protein translocase subunit SecF, partial [Nitrospinales bacterium]